MKENLLVSVVVPVYNVEAYLNQCISSICSQSYKNLQIILVDDGSMDSSGKICDERAVCDSRIQVIHKTNGGLSDARNAGIAAAEGKYICFIDSDDYIDTDMIGILLNECEENGSDIAMCEYRDVYDGKWFCAHNDKNQDTCIMSGREAFKQFLLEERRGFVVAWNKLYRVSLFRENNITYPMGMIHEDCYTTYKLYLASAKVSYIDRPLYFYRHREGSIQTEGNPDRDAFVVAAYEEILSLVNHKYPEFTQVAEYRYIMANLDSIRNVVSIRQQKYVLTGRKNVIRLAWYINPYLNGIRRLRVQMLTGFPHLYPYINKRYNQIKRIFFNVRFNLGKRNRDAYN